MPISQSLGMVAYLPTQLTYIQNSIISFQDENVIYRNSEKENIFQT